MQVDVRSTTDEIVQQVAGCLERAIDADIAQRGRCVIAFSGGSTPLPLFELLATDEWQSRIDWQHVLVAQVDERFVPRDDEHNNFGQIEQALLNKLDPAPQRILRVPVELSSVYEAAQQYEQQLRSALGNDGCLDIALLGMGSDGHTASLFPGSSTLDVTEQWVAADGRGRPIAARITLTLPFLNRSRRAWFMIAGRDKAHMLHRVIDCEPGQPPLPAQQITVTGGQLRWFIDTDAAGELQRTTTNDGHAA